MTAGGPINRVPKGVPTGGEFAEGVRGEPAYVDLEFDADDRFSLEPGEERLIDPDDDVIRAIEVYRSDDGEDYHITGTMFENFYTMRLGDEFENASDEDKDSYLNNRNHIIEGFFTERFGKDADGSACFDMHGDSWESQSLEFTRTLDHAPDDNEAIEEVWEKTPAVTCHNEMDPGTFNATDATRLLRERLAEHDTKHLPPVDVTDQQKQELYDGFVHYRLEMARGQYIDESLDEYDSYAQAEEAADRMFTPENISPSAQSEVKAAVDDWISRTSGDVAITSEGEGSRTSGMFAVGQDLGSSGLSGVGFEHRKDDGLVARLAADRLQGAQLRYKDGRTMWPETDFRVGDNGTLVWE